MGLFDRIREALAPQAPVARERLELRGVQVVVENSRDDILTSDVIARLDEALELIDRFAPRRLAHLRRDVAYIWVVRWPCRGAYLPAERACVTALTLLAARDIPASVAASSI